MIQRRLYIYIVLAASLGMLLIGLVNLGTTALNQVLGATPPYTNVRDAYAGFGAVTVVGLPVWAIHWWIAQRLANRNPDERASAIRRLYLYLALAAIGVTLAIFLRRFLEDGIGFVLGSSTDGPSIARSLWAVLVLFGFWLYHFRTTAADRTVVGESGTSATLRRWYAYGMVLFGLAFLLFGARNLLQQIWVLLVDRTQVIAPGGLVPTALATMLTGLTVWGFHSQWTSVAPIAEDDQRSTLRAVQRFLALTGSVALALFGASQLLYYALARVLGIEHPGGVSTDILVAVASPAATVIVFGLAWLWIRRQLAVDAGETEAARQAGVRHLYTHLVAFLALATLAIGVAGLLWTLSDQVLNHLAHLPSPSGGGQGGGDWRDKISLFVTLIVVGVPMWLTHWRQSPDPAERYTLSRRLYLYATLLGSVLAVLISGAIFVYRLLALVLGTSDAGGGAPVIDMGRAMSVILVAAAIGLYHRRALRSDSAARPAVPASVTPSPLTPSPLAGEGRGGGLTITIKGATEEQIRRALADLPDGASYTIQR
jgi:hypothetical protein